MILPDLALGLPHHSLLCPAPSLLGHPSLQPWILLSVSEDHEGIDSGVDTFRGIWILIREHKRWKSFEVGKEEFAHSGRTNKGLFLLKSLTQCPQSHSLPFHTITG